MRHFILASTCLFAACGGDLPPSTPDLNSPPAPVDKVDVLFMLDDSPSMSPKTDELKARFPQLLKVVDDLATQGHPASYHFGVVTSDLGAGSQANGGCQVGGLGGKLQALGHAHGANCQPPGGGLNFIDYDQISHTSNLPAGVSLPDEFTCMASVGSGGCGFEHQLEAVYRALHDCQSPETCSIPENQGFMRPDAMLVVVLVTDEDDCSAPPDTDLFAATAAGTYGMEASYRCTNYGIVCGNPSQLAPYGDSGGPLMGCRGAPNPNGNVSGPPPDGEGKLFDVNRYIDFFKSLKPDPRDVLLAAITAPSQPFQVVVGSPGVNDPATGGYGACPAGTMIGTPVCAVLLGHSCDASADFFGDPAVRINQVVAAVNGQVSSICDLDYTPPMVGVGQAIAARLSAP